ncbi:hypothetical protein MUNTM_45650 [Mycobacterium sp. MUNTM1]
MWQLWPAAWAALLCGDATQPREMDAYAVELRRRRETVIPRPGNMVRHLAKAPQKRCSILVELFGEGCGEQRKS